MSEQIVGFSQVRRKYRNLSAREQDLQQKNENLQRYVTEVLTRNAALSAEVRKLEGVRR